MDPISRRDFVRLVFGAIAAACGASLAVALFGQYVLDLQPCPWCIMQRLIVIVIGVLCLVAALARGRRAAVLHGVLGAGVLALAVCGVWAAVYQNTVAARTLSCAFTFADRFLMSLGLDQWWPWMFRIGATCADAAHARLLGLPFEFWSGGLFVLIALAMMALAATARRSMSRR